MGSQEVDWSKRLTLEGAAQLLGVSASTVRRMLRSGHLEHVATGSGRRPIRRADVERLRQEQSRLLTVAEAAEMLKVSRHVVEKLLSDRTLPRTGTWRRPIGIDDAQAVLDAGGVADPAHQGRIPVAEAAAILGLAAGYTQRRTAAGKLPAVKDARGH